MSLFDGMACGMIAFRNLGGLVVEKYDAYEIDKYAIQTSTLNFPDIKHHGDVFTADFTQYTNVDYLIGGSPCTYWSIAQKNNRETEASGLGWELFSQYVRALNEAKPKYFIYENNKSMSKKIRASISETFGFDAICINSALVSAQNRQRLYWVGKRNSDGTYSKVHVEQPDDRMITLKDVLDVKEFYGVWSDYNNSMHYEKAWCIGTGIGTQRSTTHQQVILEPVKIHKIAKGGQKDKVYEITFSDHLEIDEVRKYVRNYTVEECKRLQTVPSEYQFPVSNAQAYKMLGNGWTCDVISHLIKSTLK